MQPLWKAMSAMEALVEAGADINALSSGSKHCMHYFARYVAGNDVPGAPLLRRRLLGLGASAALAFNKFRAPLDELLGMSLPAGQPQAYIPELIRCGVLQDLDGRLACSTPAARTHLYEALHWVLPAT